MEKLSAKQKEAAKTEEEKSEDIAYTINHALTCAATDIIDPFFAAWTHAKFGKRLHTSWCNLTHQHDHGDHHHHHGHDHHHHGHHDSCHGDNPTFTGSLHHYVVGEALGDVGAVPIAIAMQRYAPGVMHKINDGVESIAGGLYRKGADRTARNWAKREGISPTDAAVKEKADEIYHHEVEHFGQAAVWTAASVGLNVASQKYITKNELAIPLLVGFKAAGALQSALLLMGGRSMFPGHARAWDQWTNRNLFLPATKKLSKVFGVDEKTVDRMAKKEGLAEVTNSQWEGKIEQPKEQQSSL